MASKNWIVKSIDIMGKSKDTMRGQVSQANMATICSAIKQLGSTHIAIVCPLDEHAEYPDPKPTANYFENWIAAARTAGLKVFFRGSWLNFEAIYDAPKYTPTSTPSIALGTTTNVLNGTDTTSYLYKSWNFIKTHPTFFQAGDIWGPCPEPESQGIGGATSDMFSSYNVMGQWLVDLKTTADNAFTSLGYNVGEVMTGMTSINGGTVLVNQIGSSYWTQIGQYPIDHYVTFGEYSGQLDTIFSNAGVDLYINEWGTTAGFGGSLDDSQRTDNIHKMYGLFSSKSYIKGLNYWQATSGTEAKENILNYQTFAIKNSARVIEKFYKGTSRVKVN